MPNSERTHDRYCPRCGSGDPSRSRRRGLDRVLSLMNVFPYRCRACMRRFYSWGDTARRLAA